MAKNKYNVVQKFRKERSVAKSLKTDIERLNGLCEKAEWHKTGWPDLLIFMPGNEFWVVETKRPVNGQLSPRQIVVHRELRKLYFRVRLVWDDESKKILLNEIKSVCQL